MPISLRKLPDGPFARRCDGSLNLNGYFVGIVVNGDGVWPVRSMPEAPSPRPHEIYWSFNRSERRNRYNLHTTRHTLNSFNKPWPNLDGKSVLITGGTGSFGRAFSRVVLDHFKPARLIVFSRDEMKQYEMAQELDDVR